MIISFKRILIEYDLFMLFGGVSNNSHHDKDNNEDKILLDHKKINKIINASNNIIRIPSK